MTRPHRIATDLAGILTSLLASTALAATTLPGINVRWDNCYADGGVMNKSFACDTNAGSELMVLSVQLDTAMPNVSGMEIRVSLKASAPTLPAWWLFRSGPVGPGNGCRPSSLCFIPSPVTPMSSCEDWGAGHEGGGIGAYRVDEIGPGSSVALIASAVPPSSLAQLQPTTEYVVGELRIDHAHTEGMGSCGGCDTPVCVLFTSLNITTPVLADNRLFTQGANGVDSQVIHWQNGQIAGLLNTCTGTFNCNTQFDCVLSAEAAPTAARHSTWGAVKALYR